MTVPWPEHRSGQNFRGSGAALPLDELVFAQVRFRLQGPQAVEAPGEWAQVFRGTGRAAVHGLEDRRHQLSALLGALGAAGEGQGEEEVLNVHTHQGAGEVRPQLTGSGIDGVNPRNLVRAPHGA